MRDALSRECLVFRILGASTFRYYCFSLGLTSEFGLVDPGRNTEAQELLPHSGKKRTELDDRYRLDIELTEKEFFKSKSVPYLSNRMPFMAGGVISELIRILPRRRMSSGQCRDAAHRAVRGTPTSRRIVSVRHAVRVP